VRLIKDKDIHLVHSHLAKSIVLGYFAARNTERAFVAHEHVGPMWPHFGGSPLHRLENWMMCRATLFCMARADVVIAVAQPTLDWVLQQRPALANKSVVITNGIDLDNLGRISAQRDEHRAAVRQELGVPPECPLILYASSFRFVKRWDLFVLAAARILQTRPDIHFVGAGAGPLYAEMKELVRQQRAEANIHLIGLRDDVPRLMAASDVFLMPSAMESDSIVVKEAMALGLPVVGSAIPALSEKITEGEDGFLVEVGDTQAMATRCLALVSNQTLRHQMSRAAMAVAQERFSIEGCTRAMETIYEKALQR
jgi:glycosyltransferase involved in cell wall biosynthesis